MAIRDRAPRQDAKVARAQSQPGASTRIDRETCLSRGGRRGRLGEGEAHRHGHQVADRPEPGQQRPRLRLPHHAAASPFSSGLRTLFGGPARDHDRLLRRRLRIAVRGDEVRRLHGARRRRVRVVSRSIVVLSLVFTSVATVVYVLLSPALSLVFHEEHGGRMDLRRLRRMALRDHDVGDIPGARPRDEEVPDPREDTRQREPRDGRPHGARAARVSQRHRPHRRLGGLRRSHNRLVPRHHAKAATGR